MIYNCIFIENFAFGLGGALHISSRLITIKKTQLIRNLAPYAGACYFEQDPLSDFIDNNDKIILLSSNIFYNNLAAGWGGSIYTSPFMKGYNMTYDNNYFFKQMAIAAGAISHNGYSGIHLITNCSFVSNFAEYAGGIYLYTYGDFTLTHCKFIFNVALSVRLSIFSIYSLMKEIILTTVYTSFYASSTYINSARFSMIDLSALDLTPNFLPGNIYYGGAFLQDFYLNISSLYIKKVLFKRNLALHSGGAITVITGFHEESDSKFIENYAVRFGGVFYLEDRVQSYHTNSVFWKNSAGSS